MNFKNVVRVLLAMLAVPAFAANGTMKGDGSAENPFQIEDYEDLKAIGKGDYLYSSNYILTKESSGEASEMEMREKLLFTLFSLLLKAGIVFFFLFVQD